MVDPNDTIYTKDARILANLKVNLEVLIMTLRIELGKHGHSYNGSLGMIHATQELVTIHRNVEKCCEGLSEEVKANINLVYSGEITTGEDS